MARDDAAWQAHLAHFREAIGADAGMIMTGHILAPSADSLYPASISSAVSNGVLRRELGYRGVVITDDIAMGAISRSWLLPDAAVQAVAAGADVVLAVEAPNRYDGIYEALLAAARKGEFHAARIDASVARILALKEKFLSQ